MEKTTAVYDESEDRLRLNLPDLGTRRQIADYTQISVATFARWAMEGKGPKFIRLGGAVRYRRDDVIAWLDALD